ncbi:hypothetical protein NM688_g2190 [Phlebia brevispora]|uniref:Uncharacterized protein n=1 Tax=Phlebia brevispora TaxID=194682 RepID=A0ACC1T9K5_9APHY|nr:hypothetical protein NM688_g2190 [Phlebia brevispora]
MAIDTVRPLTYAVHARKSGGLSGTVFLELVRARESICRGDQETRTRLIRAVARTLLVRLSGFTLTGHCRAIAARLKLGWSISSDCSQPPSIFASKPTTTMAGTDSKFPIDLSKLKPLKLDPSNPKLTDEQFDILKHNVQLMRDAIVLFTATGAARGVSGHTGGAYDTVPEVNLLLSLFKHSNKYVPVLFDEAGHRVATQYLMSAVEGAIPAEHLLHYREANSKLPGHPELGLTPGVKFSSGRLGHVWPWVNGIALANRDKTVFMLGSDGSQQEGNDAEAARLAVAQKLNVKLIIDDNDVTIAGHPSQYLKGYDISKTLEGHGLKVVTVLGEDFRALWGALCEVLRYDGPAAVVCKRLMAPGVADIEGTTHGHDVIPVKAALKYFEARGYAPNVAGDILNNIKPSAVPYLYIGSTKEVGANRVIFGEAVNAVLDKIGKEEAAKKVMVIDSDLEGSTGLKVIHQKHPEVFIPSGIMERGNFSAAAGFGFDKDKFGVFSTFGAFLEMVISEITMARLNFCNVLCHFSHSGVDEMADNTCHFGINHFFADNGLADTQSWLYWPADGAQMIKIVERVFFERGIRFIFSTRSKVPYILKEDGKTRFFGDDYEFVPGKDEVIVEGKAGYVVSFGDMLYRSWDAVLRCRQEGLDVGLINKPTLNLVDEQTIRKIGASPFVLVVESLNQKTGLGVRFGTWLLERQLTPKYAYIGTNKEGCGGLSEQIPHQGLDPQSIILKIRQLSQKTESYRNVLQKARKCAQQRRHIYRTPHLSGPRICTRPVRLFAVPPLTVKLPTILTLILAERAPALALALARAALHTVSYTLGPAAHGADNVQRDLNLVWQLEQIHDGLYKLKIVGAPVGNRGGRLYAFLTEHDQHYAGEWRLAPVPRVDKDAYLIELHGTPLGWVASGEKEPEG